MNPPVRELVDAWTKAVENRDLEAALALWTDDGLFAGSSEDEVARGHGIRVYLAAVFSTDHVLTWDWEEPVVHEEGDLAWFFVPGRLLVDGTKPRPYRATGVARLVRGEWLLAMWSGSEPN